MLSPEDVERIKAALATLEKARERCTDSGLQKLIDDWIIEVKKELADG
jgi:hypothetical protein